MKSLQESLFDTDLVSQKLPYEKLLKGRISKQDILSFIAGFYEGDFIDVRNSVFRKWCKDFYNREVGDQKDLVLYAAYYTWEEKGLVSQEAIDWLKPGKIHHIVSWNDCMYANSLDVDWSFWGGEDHWNTIYEWIFVQQKNRWGDSNLYILVNRKEYAGFDRAIIHKMIETLSK